MRNGCCSVGTRLGWDIVALLRLTRGECGSPWSSQTVRQPGGSLKDSALPMDSSRPYPSEQHRDSQARESRYDGAWCAVRCAEREGETSTTEANRGVFVAQGRVFARLLPLNAGYNRNRS